MPYHNITINMTAVYHQRNRNLENYMEYDLMYQNDSRYITIDNFSLYINSNGNVPINSYYQTDGLKDEQLDCTKDDPIENNEVDDYFLYNEYIDEDDEMTIEEYEKINLEIVNHTDVQQTSESDDDFM